MGEVVQFKKKDAPNMLMTEDAKDFFRGLLSKMLAERTDSLLLSIPDIAMAKGVPADTEFMIVLMGVGDVTLNKEVEPDATS